MKSRRNKREDRAIDAFIGYAVIVLAILCFLVVLAIATMAVRFFAGGIQ